MPQDQLGLSDTPPNSRQLQAGGAIVGLLLVVSLAVLPFRNAQLVKLDAFVPTVDGILFIADLVAASLIYSQAAILNSRALAVLGSGYVYSALLLVPHALTFPGGFAESGLLNTGASTTFWLAMFRRAGLASAIILYAVTKSRRAPGDSDDAERPLNILRTALVAIALAMAVFFLTTDGVGLLPLPYASRVDVINPQAITYELPVFALLATAVVLLFRARRSTLDVWLLVAFSGSVMQSLLIMTLAGGRSTVGWYWLYAMMLFSHLVLLFALVGESNQLYARLALVTAARERERDARIASISAATAAMTDEVGQPLTGVKTHARAGLKWLDQPRPDVEQAQESLRAVLAASQRTGEVIKGLRTIFSRPAVALTEFCLNDLVRATTADLYAELTGARVSLQLSLTQEPLRILANRAQVERALVNLLINAIESLETSGRRDRRIVIHTALEGDEALLEVSDNGVGIAAGDAERIFEPFYTTKARSAGLGLSICRSIVVAHGGHLWGSARVPDGASLHLRLPLRLAPPHGDGDALNG